MITECIKGHPSELNPSVSVVKWSEVKAKKCSVVKWSEVKAKKCSVVKWSESQKV